MISIKIVDTISDITKNINSSLASMINAEISRKSQQIQQNVKELIDEWIITQPEIISLQSTSTESLAGQFGIPRQNVSSAIDGIITAIKESTTVELKPFNNKLKGGLFIYVQPVDFNNVLSLDVGHVVYAGGDLHWLNWLITLGSKVIVANYHYEASGGSGRSGLGVMSIGSSFRVPPKFAGTIDNNFITRALQGDDKVKQITNIVKKALN